MQADQRAIRLGGPRGEVATSHIAGANHILFSGAIEAKGAKMVANACEMGLDGIVCKRPGRSNAGAAGRNGVNVRNRRYREDDGSP